MNIDQHFLWTDGGQGINRGPAQGSVGACFIDNDSFHEKFIPSFWAWPGARAGNQGSRCVRNEGHRYVARRVLR